MNDQINQLMAWYRLAPSLGIVDSSMGGRQTGVNAPLAFAQQMLGYGQGPQQQQMPNYFSGLPQPTDPTQGYNRLAALMGRRF